MEKQNPRIIKTILYNNETYEGIIISDFKLYYRATVLKNSGIGITTDSRTNGTELKTQIVIHI